MADKADDIRQEIKKGEQDIEETRTAMFEKLALLKERAQETVDSVKHTFDLRYQVKQRPWLIFSGSLLAGYMLGRRCGVSRTADNTSSAESQVTSHFKGDLATIKGAAFGAVTSALWTIAKRALLPLAPRINNPAHKPSTNPTSATEEDTHHNKYVRESAVPETSNDKS